MVKKTTMQVMGIFGAIIIVSIFFMRDYASTLGLSSTIGLYLVNVLPSSLTMILGMIAVASAKRENSLVIGGVICVGIGGAMLLGELNTIGLITAGSSLAQIQALVIVCSVIIGGLFHVSG